MNIVVFDNSKGIAYIKTKRHFSKILSRITHRIFVGNLPSRCISEMLYNIGFMVSKNSDILILVADKSGFHGWAGYHFGKTKCKTRYDNLLKSNRYLLR